MNEKLSLQNIADALAQKSGVQKKVADAFAKAFFDVLTEAFAAGEDTVKLKGLGTFKLVQVGSRESVNVKNGERIVIAGYRKVSFTAEESVVSKLNSAERDDVQEETVPETIEYESTDEKMEEEGIVDMPEEESIDALIAVPEPVMVEEPSDAFGGIDMLISTPESVEDVRQQYEEAKAKMDVVVEEARRAHAEKLRLEKLLERLEANTEPESMETKDKVEVEEHVVTEEMSVTEQTPEGVEAEKTVSATEALISDDDRTPESMSDEKKYQEKEEEEKRQEAFKRVMGEMPRLVDDGQNTEKTNKKTWMTLLIVLFVGIIGFFVYRTFVNIEAVQEVPQVAQYQKPAVKKPAKEVVKKPVREEVKDSVKTEDVKKPAEEEVEKKQTAKEVEKQPAKEAEKKQPSKEVEKQSSRPKTHVMLRGESLTRISQKYYGTKDSVRAIIRINTFRDPDNVPVGAVVKLP